MMFGQDLGKIALLLAVLSVVVLGQDHGEEAALEMGPVAFMWPPDREWGAAQDNHAPCGSSAVAGVNRTQFPLSRSLFLVGKQVTASDFQSKWSSGFGRTR